MTKTLIALALLATLTGCTSLTPVKYAANQVCGASNERKQELTEKFDKATFPHEVRVNCHVQENQ